jgi:adenylate cyclase
MGRDEVGTLARLNAHRCELIDPKIAERGGRIIKTTGDGILIEFPSVVEAVRCAIEVQQGIMERNAEMAPDKRIEFRFGVNLGDVIVENGDIHGDGVNVAARLENIADPGGICLSAKVFDEIQGKLDIAFEEAGEQKLKNIDRAVRVYRIQPQGSKPEASRPAFALPDKPSIAVLPFVNHSNDPQQEYFSDGITDDIITELSRFSELFVIARNSSFQFKGKSIDVRDIGRNLGVRYVLEGSIRPGGGRVRFTAQLVDANTGAHLWAERYDREVKDVFSVQDEVVRTIIAILAAHVNKAEIERTQLKPPTAWQAYDYYMRTADTYASYTSLFKVEELYETRRLLKHALAYSLPPLFHATAYLLISQ